MLCGSLSALGCAGSDAHEIGFTRDPAPPEPFYTAGASFVGRWLGEAIDPLAFGVGTDQAAPSYVFPSGSSRILLELAAQPESPDPAALAGSLTFGDGVALAAATDGARGYPEGFDYGEYLSYAPPSRGIENYDGVPPMEGFAYPVESRTFDSGVPDGVLRLKYDPRRYLDSWCALQAPHLQPGGGYAALPFAAGGAEMMADGTNQTCSAFGADDLSACPADMALLPPDEYEETYEACSLPGPVIYQMSCDRIFLTRFCSCTDAACGAGLENSAGLMLRIAGNTLIGIFVDSVFLNVRGLSTPIGEARFRRVTE